MKKTKKKSKSAKASACATPDETRHIPSRDAVTSNTDLLYLIFTHISTKFLISTVQQTCKQWKSIIESLPRTYLNNVPRSIPSQHRQISPLLYKHFKPLFDTDARQIACMKLPPSSRIKKTYKSLPGFSWDMTIADGRAKHDVFASPDASWRQMHLASPPIRTLVYTRISDGSIQTVTVEGGIRMGQYFDIVAGILTHSTKRGYGFPELSWPWDNPTQPRDELRITRWFVNVYMIDDSKNGRLTYETTAWRASSKWLLKCEPGKDPQILVDL